MKRWIGIACLVAAVLVIALQPVIAPHDPMRTELGQALDAPSRQHPLGTDTTGRDVMARLAAGTWHSLLVAGTALAVSSLLGLALGAVAGLARGAIDRAVTTAVDLLLAFPRFVILLNLAAVFRFPDALSIGLLIGTTTWMSTARLVRTEVLSISERAYVEAARAAGAPRGRILSFHIAPHVARLVLERSGLRLGAIVLFAASLDYLGIGLSADRPTWGRMILEGQEHLATAPWIVLSSVAMLGLTVVGVVLAGDGADRRPALALDRAETPSH